MTINLDKYEVLVYPGHGHWYEPDAELSICCETYSEAVDYCDTIHEHHPNYETVIEAIK